MVPEFDLDDPKIISLIEAITPMVMESCMKAIATTAIKMSKDSSHINGEQALVAFSKAILDTNDKVFSSSNTVLN